MSKHMIHPQAKGNNRCNTRCVRQVLGKTMCACDTCSGNRRNSRTARVGGWALTRRVRGTAPQGDVRGRGAAAAHPSGTHGVFRSWIWVSEASVA
eukprot:3251278-Prymnesium_polylepis.1